MVKVIDGAEIVPPVLRDRLNTYLIKFNAEFPLSKGSTDSFRMLKTTIFSLSLDISMEVMRLTCSRYGGTRYRLIKSRRKLAVETLFFRFLPPFRKQLSVRKKK